MKVALALLTKDHPELTAGSAPPLRKAVDDGLIDLFWIDGSLDDLKRTYRVEPSPYQLYVGVTGGPDAAIVFALSRMLKNQNPHYTHVGIVEQDAALAPGWRDCLDLFESGREDGLEVGAVSARCYVDRILAQRDGYALMHNLGSGMVVFTRLAAELILHNYRTHFTSENRRIFAALSGIDIGTYWAFGAHDHPITTDWGFDRILASHGYASLALVPNRVEMLDQDIAAQGLAYADAPVSVRRDDGAFETFVDWTYCIREGDLLVPSPAIYRSDTGPSLYFPHQLGRLRAVFNGGWSFKWNQGFGPFSYVASKNAELDLTVQGPIGVHVGHGQFEISDLKSGHATAPVVETHPLAVMVPGSLPMRGIRIRSLQDDSVLLAVETTLPQLDVAPRLFTWNDLPEPG